MNYLTQRSEHYFIALLTVMFMYSLTCSVIAQDKAGEGDSSSYKIKLSLAHLPTVPSIENKMPAMITENNNLSDKASLKISPIQNQNLLLSYLGSPITNSLPSLNTEAMTAQPLASIMPAMQPGLADKKKWDDTVKATYKNGLIRSIAPGVKHISIKRYTKAGSMVINVIEVNPSINPDVRIQHALAGTTLPNTRKVKSIVKQNDAIAGINASFFKTTTGVPLGTLIIGDEIVTGPIFNRVTLGIKDNKFRMARISFKGNLVTPEGEEINIDNVNQPRMLSTYNIIYSYRWGKIAPPCPKYGIQAMIENGFVTEMSKDRLHIPINGFVLVGSQKSLGKLKVGDPVKINITTNPDWSGIEHAISGGPYLVKEGKIYIDYKDQKLSSIAGRNPRTAVGYTNDNRLIMVTIDGRQKGSIGASFNELANIMKGFGCYNAMNLDGGSSTQMIIKDRVVNSPLNRGGNFVSNGLIVRIGAKNS